MRKALEDRRMIQEASRTFFLEGPLALIELAPGGAVPTARLSETLSSLSIGCSKVSLFCANLLLGSLLFSSAGLGFSSEAILPEEGTDCHAIIPEKCTGRS